MASTSAILPIITSRNLFKLNPLQKPIQAWVETLSNVEDQKVGMVDLHPSIFSVNPRLDILFKNVYWQQMYGKFDYRWAPTRGERPGRNKKPWPQKGLGKARHGSRLAPQWLGGGVAHGPRGPKSYFFMESFYQRILGLRTALTVKFHQNDLHIIDNLDLPTENPQYLEQILNERYWGPSVLFVDDVDNMPYNVTAAATKLKGITLMPTYGLNTYSMLKHNSLVMTTRSLDKIESKILFYMHNNQFRSKPFDKK